MRNLKALMAANRGRGFLRAEDATGKAIIYLYDVICGSDDEAYWWGGVGPESFAKMLAAVDAPEIELRVNCPGGDVFGGRAIAAALKDHPARKVARVDGYAASAASYVIQACDRVEMGEGAMIMIHNAWTFAWGNADEITKVADLLRKIDATLVATYEAAAKRRGVEGQDFGTLMAAETWFTGPEAVAAGLADAETAEAGGAAENSVRWDVSAYKHAPTAAGKPAHASRASGPQPPLVGEIGPEIFVPLPEAETPPPANTETEIAHRRRRARAIALLTA